MKNFLQKGQVSLITAVIGGIAMITASAFTAWATANSRVSEIGAKVQVVEEREDNHYKELRKDLSRIEEKLDKVLNGKK